MLVLPKMRRVLALLALCALLLSACGRDEAGKRAAGPGKAEEPELCPLTGLEAEDDVERPPLAVKIDNAPVARPQAGLESADIVYEELAEGGITRFLAIFHCTDPDDLGPVRSARNVDPDILVQYAPVLFGHSGAAAGVIRKVESTRGITDLRHGDHGDAYRRERGRRAPSDLFTTGEQLRGLDEAEGVKGPPRTGLEFDPALLEQAGSPAPKGSPGGASPAAPAAAPGSSVSFSYSGTREAVRYTYDTGAKKYLRFHGNAAHNSAGGDQLSAVNVVILKVRITAGQGVDAAGSRSPEISVVGGGDVTILRGGTSVEGRWNRSGLSDQTTFTDDAGKPIKLAPGNTWIHLIPQEQQITVQ
ncbi:MAG TPA: DUF3048 domain-containing protein [Actinomycetota bacterium]|nr:DUF3048 domain-containing protein [Actinomycetota bacterium]